MELQRVCTRVKSRELKIVRERSLGKKTSPIPTKIDYRPRPRDDPTRDPRTMPHPVARCLVLAVFIVVFAVQSAQTHAEMLTPGAKIVTPAADGSQSLAREIQVHVPPEDAPPANGWPVVIILHGMGGNGPDMLDNVLALGGNLTSHNVLVAPTGIGNAWNVVGEQGDSPQDDVGFP